MKTIIVEDEIRIREGISRLIQKMCPDFEVAGEAENGEEGLALIEQVNPDLVITDIKMPVMDGLEMLTKAMEDGKKFKVIVLSAYSEFSYAQQAIKLGVSEYLLKPIVVTDFVQSVRTVEKQWTEEKKSGQGLAGNLENIFFRLLYGGLQVNEELIQHMDTRFGIQQSTQFCLIQAYMGKQYEELREKIKKELGGLLKRRGILFSLLEVPKEDSIVILLYGGERLREEERWFQNELLQEKRAMSQGKYLCFGWIASSNIGSLQKDCSTLARYMDWNIAMGNAIIISYPKILQVQTVPCMYPIELENQLKIAMCTQEQKEIDGCLYKFFAFFSSGQVYSPKEIKESFVRFIWALINVGKEIGVLDYHHFDQQKMIDSIMNAISFEELKEVCLQLTQFLNLKKESSAGNANLTIKRAESMIREFYNTGITLEEIALKLNITPEYLGTQFRREIGVNFSTYIKELRINKAKELLIGSQLKLYEIAEKIGYTDAKYFSRVFREMTGQLPADYRKSNR